MKPGAMPPLFLTLVDAGVPAGMVQLTTHPSRQGRRDPPSRSRIRPLGDAGIHQRTPLPRNKLFRFVKNPLNSLVSRPTSAPHGSRCRKSQNPESGRQTL